MSKQLDRVFLIALSSALYYLADNSAFIFIPITATLILGTLNFLLKKPVFQGFAFIGFLSLCIPFPLFSIFLPVFLYDILQTVFRWLILLFPAILFFNN